MTHRRSRTDNDAHAPVGIARFIQTRLQLRPVSGLPELSLYAAHPGSGLWQVAPGGEPPYWAYVWAGGLALAHHFASQPHVVRGRRVLDLGAGSGLVAIAAARAGASDVHAAETDANGAVAIALNAAANGVAIDVVTRDLLDGPVPPVDVVAVGDLFYAPDLAPRVLAFLSRCRQAGLDVLIGDPGRAALPTRSLYLIASYAVDDFALGPQADRVQGKVFTLNDDCASNGKIATP